MRGEKFLAGLAVTALIAPLCAVCILGPAVFASVFSGFLAWLAGFDVIATASVILIVVMAVFGVVRVRGARRTPADPNAEVRQ